MTSAIQLAKEAIFCDPLVQSQAMVLIKNVTMIVHAKLGMYFKGMSKVKTQLALFYWFAFFCISFTIENRKLIGSCNCAIAMA